MSDATYEGKMPTINDFCDPEPNEQKEMFPGFPSFLFTEEDFIKAKRGSQLKCQCSLCNKKFYRSKGEIAKRIRTNTPNMYCSLHCAAIAGNKIKLDNIRKNKTPLEDYTCKICGKHVLAKDTYGSGRFCCQKCSNTYSSKFGNTLEKRDQKSETLIKSSLEKTLRPCKKCGKLVECSKLAHNVVCIECQAKYKTEKELYYKQCIFRFPRSVYSKLPGYELIEQYGWYNPLKNNLGATRDHMVSKHYGWTHKIDPTIIRHPANCQIMLLSDNSSKREKCSITINELLERIEYWKE